MYGIISLQKIVLEDRENTEKVLSFVGFLCLVRDSAEVRGIRKKGRNTAPYRLVRIVSGKEHFFKMKEMDELVEIMRRLRSPDGCPWDREQTHRSLMKNMMEEAGEFLDAADEDNSDGMLEELGDLLMHIALHSVIAEEEGRFTFQDVARLSGEKMIRRHPHVFGSEKVHNASDVQQLWDRIKSGE